jgi:uroporphyrinogen-III synthase
LRVWITRAQPAAESTAERLRILGHEPLIAPLLQVRPLDDIALDLTGVGALAFTSANAVAAFAALTPRRDLPVFAVGEATARDARVAGFEAVSASDGDVHALAHHITAEGAPEGLVLHPGALEPAGDLAAALTAAGVRARNLPVYRTEAVAALPATVLSPPGAVLLHSPKAARTLAKLIPRHWPEAIEALCLSPACGAPLLGLGFHRLEAAPRPDEALMLDLLPR